MTTKHLSILLFLLAAGTGMVQAALKPMDHIVVVVNDDVITKNMLDNRVIDFRKQLELSQLSRLDPETLKKQVRK